MPLFNVNLNPKTAERSVHSSLPQFLGISEMFQYNYELVRELYESIECKKWVLSIIHGFAKHISSGGVIQT